MCFRKLAPPKMQRHKFDACYNMLFTFKKMLTLILSSKRLFQES